jgi:hypothetical protein
MNPYAKDVKLDIVSAPASEIVVTKHVGRIGGYGPTSSVFNPVVYMKNPPSNTLYRVTALISRYSTEEAKSTEIISVQGNGNAIKIHSTNYDDFIYTGTGNSVFDKFSTDADTAFIRQRGDTVEITLLTGSYLDFQNERWVSLTKKADYVTVKKEKESVDYQIQGDPNLRGELFHSSVDPAKIQAAPISDQKSSVITGINSVIPGTNPGDTFDLVSFVKKIGKKVISFLNSRFN